MYTIASASHMNVDSALLSCWEPLVCKRVANKLHTQRICCSHTPPMWLAEGPFILNTNQFVQGCSNSLPATTRLIPWLPRSCQTGPPLDTNLRKALMKGSLWTVAATSTCTALEAIQVNNTRQCFKSLWPSFIMKGAKQLTAQLVKGRAGSNRSHDNSTIRCSCSVPCSFYTGHNGKLWTIQRM